VGEKIEMSQEAQILKILQSGRAITPLDALHEVGSFRLGARILALRSKGHHIITKMINVGPARVASYRLAQ
jgi:Helix-turn-helix domain